MYFSKSYYDYVLIVVLLIVPVRACSTDQDEVHKREGRSWRLPNTSLPVEYHLHITTWIHKEILNFTGNVTIKVLVKENTSELVLHAKDLEIQSIFLQDLTTKQKIENINSRIIDDLLVIAFEKKNDADIFISGHHLSLEVHYSGVIKYREFTYYYTGEEKHYSRAINDREFGFQTISYGHRDKKIYGAYTRLEPIYARTVLPCYDEPELKAPFSVRITHCSNYTAISNMPVITTQKNDADDMITTIFQETPQMCTYLLTFVVSDFNIISKESDGILHRVFRPPNASDRGELALENSVKAIDTFQSFMNIRYALPKIDHIDVGANLHDWIGMDNWGLITYAANAFVETKYFKEINIQNHGIVRQWFGNLVSPMWWDSIWLSEGLTTYYSYKLTGMLYPQLRAKTYFQNDNCNQEIWESVIEYVEEPADIKRKFGDSIHRKAPCLLYLLITFIGEKTFDNAVRDYLKSYDYSNANSDQFFERIQNAVDNSDEQNLKMNVSEMMKPYFTRSTRPYLTIRRNLSDTNWIYIKQKSIGEYGLTEELWQIPLIFTKKNEELSRGIKFILTVPEIELDLRKYNKTFSRREPVVVSIPGIDDYHINFKRRKV